MSFVAAPRRRGLVLALLACVVLALGGLVTTSASAVSPAPTTIVIDSITSDIPLPSDQLGAAAPYVVVKAGATFHVNVSFYDATGAPASFNSDTTLTVASNVGTLTPTTGLALKNHQTATINTKITAAVNRVVLTVSAGSGSKAPTPGSSYVAGVKDFRFDVLSDVDPDAASTDGQPFQKGIGGDTGCANATKAAPVCEIVTLPHGAASNVLLSVGACDTGTTSTYAPCFTGPKGQVGGAIVQTLFAQPGTPYSAADPVTIVVKCDKTLCGTGSIQDLTLAFSFAASGDLVDAGPCPAKGVAIAAVGDTPAQPCVDYVQSKRDGSGDTHLYFLTPGDMRIGIG